MKSLQMILICSLVSVVFFSCKKQSSAANNNNNTNNNNPPPSTFEWSFENTPAWTDEFDNNGSPDQLKWGYDIGGNGWGNNELQYYTNGLNAAVSNGVLKIIAKKEAYSGKEYTSARMITKNKADWQYGRIEAKAKLPKGRGTWPAIWMLPTENVYGSWPNSGEIDIMEHVGYDLNNVHFTLHAAAFYGSAGKGGSKNISGATDDFHLYRVDWAPYGIRGYFDNEKIFEYLNPGTGFNTWPYDRKFHLLLNIAIGGTWGGAQGVDDTIFPATMEVDYIRVYKFTR